MVKGIVRHRTNKSTAKFVRDQRLLKLAIKGLKKISFIKVSLIIKEKLKYSFNNFLLIFFPQKTRSLAELESRKKYKAKLVIRAFTSLKLHLERRIKKSCAVSIANKITKKISLRKFLKNSKLMKIDREFKKKVDPVQVFNMLHKTKFFRRLRIFNKQAKRHRCLLGVCKRNKKVKLQQKFFSFWKYYLYSREEKVYNTRVGEK